MTNKITGLKLEEIANFDIKKFKSCIVRYDGRCGDDFFEKEITIEQALSLYEAEFTLGSRNKEVKRILLTCPKELVYVDIKIPYTKANVRVSEYDLIRA